MTTQRNHLLSPWNHFKCLLDALKLGAKVALVAGGYAVSAVVAVLVVGFLEWVQGPGGAPGGGTMKAVVQFFVFLGVFGLGAVLPTMAGLYFLRPFPKFWQWCSFVALGLSGLGVGGTIALRFTDCFVPSSTIFPVLVSAAVLAAAFTLCACFAPSQGARIRLALAAGLEIALIAGWISFVARGPN